MRLQWLWSFLETGSRGAAERDSTEPRTEPRDEPQIESVHMSGPARPRSGAACPERRQEIGLGARVFSAQPD